MGIFSYCCDMLTLWWLFDYLRMCNSNCLLASSNLHRAAATCMVSFLVDCIHCFLISWRCHSSKSVGDSQAIIGHWTWHRRSHCDAQPLHRISKGYFPSPNWYFIHAKPSGLSEELCRSDGKSCQLLGAQRVWFWNGAERRAEFSNQYFSSVLLE